MCGGRRGPEIMFNKDAPKLCTIELRRDPMAQEHTLVQSLERLQDCLEDLGEQIQLLIEAVSDNTESNHALEQRIEEFCNKLTQN